MSEPTEGAIRASEALDDASADGFIRMPNGEKEPLTHINRARLIDSRAVAPAVRELWFALAHLIEFADNTGKGNAKQQKDARAALERYRHLLDCGEKR